MYNILIVLDFIVALLLVGSILLQSGKGADSGMSSAGSSFTAPVSAANFLTKFTAFLATLFFIISLVIGKLSVSNYEEVSAFENILNSDSEEPKDVAEKKASNSNDVPDSSS